MKRPRRFARSSFGLSLAAHLMVSPADLRDRALGYLRPDLLN